jgi:hypothetical protein
MRDYIIPTGMECPPGYKLRLPARQKRNIALCVSTHDGYSKGKRASIVMLVGFFDGHGKVAVDITLMVDSPETSMGLPAFWSFPTGECR